MHKFLFIPLSLFVLSTFPSSGMGSELSEKLSRYLGEHSSVLVADEEGLLYSHNIDEKLVPASILKLTTALSAIEHLGKNYRFKTEFFLSPQNDLTVRGTGDPQLVSEEWHEIAEYLKAEGKVPSILQNLYLDNTLFEKNMVVPGVSNTLNPYDAMNGALVANFNTIYVSVDAKNNVKSAESQTPLTPLAVRLSKTLDSGKHRINISRNRDHILPYVGELFQKFLEQQQVTIGGKILDAPVRGTDQLIYVHHNSNRLLKTIEIMMLYSNNFIANQLFLASGMAVHGPQASLKKGVKVSRALLENKLGISKDDFDLVEGSGISRQNKITARAMSKVLDAFHPYQRRLAKHMGARVKTGTLKGVYSMVGYLPQGDRSLRFVIMLNQKRNYRDKILKILIDEYTLDS